jgi:hypothetical protein
MRKIASGGVQHRASGSQKQAAWFQKQSTAANRGKLLPEEEPKENNPK